MPAVKVIKLDGPVILDWGNGIRFQLSPAGIEKAAASKPRAKSAKAGRPGRKPSPATQAVIDAMEADHASGKQRGRDAYLQVLQGAGYDGSPAAASQILAREAQRVFGTTLGRAKAAKKPGKKARRGKAKKSAKRAGTKGAGVGRQPSKETVLVRQQVEKDAAAGLLKDATHYVRWLVKQPGAKIGLKGARPIVYRELRKAREASE